MHGTIIAGAKRVELTADDLLWAGRAAACEGVGSAKGTAAVLWTWASRLGVSSRDSYGELIRAHSQPVNAIWLADGTKCRPGGEWYGRSYVNTAGVTVEPCSAERLAHRVRCRSLVWEDLAPFVRDTVTAFAAGKLPNPVPRAVDFASGLSLEPGEQILAEVGGNQFITTKASRAWPKNHVQVLGVDGSVASDAAAGAAGVAGVALGLAAAYGAYRAWKARP